MDEVFYSNTQEAMKEYADSHGICMDAYLHSKSSMYNTEMQIASIKELAHRSRYNGSMMDVNDLQPGKNYGSLKDSYVIFICDYDPFGLGRYKYEFCSMEVGVPGFVLGEGTRKVFVNLHGTFGDISPELKELLDYMAGRKSATECGLGLIKEIDKIVVEANRDEKWRKECMKFERELLWREAEGRAEGRAEGEARGEIKGVYLLIKNLCDMGVAMDVAVQKAAEDFGKSIVEVKEIIGDKMVG